MKIIDADAFDALLVDAQRRAKSNFQYGFLSSVRENLAMMPEAEAYKEARERIENMAEVIEDMAGIIEDQQERIDIMAANEVVHCKDCEHGYPLLPDYISCQISQENESGCHMSHRPEWFCANGKRKECDHDYEQASDYRDHCVQFESTYNPEDGSM